jgi:cytochrome c oxidase assembly factor CtaG
MLDRNLAYVLDNWSFDPFVILVAVVVALNENGLRQLARRGRPDRARRRRAHAVLFYGGLAVLLLAVCSPVDYWAGYYFFVHMVEHILIMFVAPALIVAGAPWLPLIHGLPVGVRRRAMRALILSRWAAPVRAVATALTGGWLAVVLFNAAMVLWHLPALFDLAERNQLVHIWLMHASFFGTGVLFWLQVIPSYPLRPKLGTRSQIAAVLSTNVVMIFLAMALSLFTDRSLYPVYNHLAGVKLAPFASQQIGAAILWVCGDFWAYPALIALIRRAMAEEGGAGAVIDRVLHVRPALGKPGP